MGIVLTVAIVALAQWEPLLKEAIARCLIEHMPESRVEVDIVWLPAGAMPAQPEPPSGVWCQPSGWIASGLEQVQVSFRDDPRRHVVQVRVRTSLRIPVAVRTLQPDHLIRASDFEIRWVDVLNPKRRLATQMEQLVDRVTDKPIPQGQPVEYDRIRPAHLIRPGDSVDLLYTQDEIQIVLRGVVKQHAARGDTVRISVEDTGRTYLAIVESSDTVVWIRTL